jgi:hypothetical protein
MAVAVSSNPTTRSLLPVTASPLPVPSAGARLANQRSGFPLICTSHIISLTTNSALRVTPPSTSTFARSAPRSPCSISTSSCSHFSASFASSASATVAASASWSVLPLCSGCGCFVGHAGLHESGDLRIARDRLHWSIRGCRACSNEARQQCLGDASSRSRRVRRYKG